MCFCCYCSCCCLFPQCQPFSSNDSLDSFQIKLSQLLSLAVPNLSTTMLTAKVIDLELPCEMAENYLYLRENVGYSLDNPKIPEVGLICIKKMRVRKQRIKKSSHHQLDLKNSFKQAYLQNHVIPPYQQDQT